MGRRHLTPFTRAEFNEDKMRSTFDIFTDSSNAQPVWIESVQDLEDARESLRAVARIAPRRDCFIYSKESGVVEIITRADFQALRMAYSPHGLLDCVSH
jgi:hypothetical protein